MTAVRRPAHSGAPAGIRAIAAPRARHGLDSVQPGGEPIYPLTAAPWLEVGYRVCAARPLTYPCATPRGALFWGPSPAG